jgi:3-deoxy-7-phosphoheptulonate synthase
MLIVMRHGAAASDVAGVVAAVESHGLKAHAIPGAQRVAIGITGNKGALEPAVFESLPGVLEVIRVSHAYKLVSREVKPENSVVDIGGVQVGGHELVVVAGPCAVESHAQTLAIAERVKASGARLLRGGAFKPRTSPYSFQGLGQQGLEILAEARAQTGLPIVTEAVDEQSLDLVERYADAIQIGSAEYILSEGNYQVVLCERGVRTFSDFSRNTLDLAVVPAVKQISHLPILVDPSHGTGRRDKVAPLSRASAAVGADGLMIEVHNDPDRALSDGMQSLTPELFEQLMRDLAHIAPVVGRSL